MDSNVKLSKHFIYSLQVLNVQEQLRRTFDMMRRYAAQVRGYGNYTYGLFFMVTRHASREKLLPLHVK